MLEIVDDAFDSIAHEIDSYATALQRVGMQSLLGEPVNSISIRRFIDELRSAYKIPREEVRRGRSDKSTENEVIAELQKFGFNKIGDIYDAISKYFVDRYKASEIKENLIGFLRNVMLYADCEKYLTHVPFNWSWIDEPSLEFLATKYGMPKAKKNVSDS